MAQNPRITTGHSHFCGKQTPKDGATYPGRNLRFGSNGLGSDSCHPESKNVDKVKNGQIKNELARWILTKNPERQNDSMCVWGRLKIELSDEHDSLHQKTHIEKNNEHCQI